MRGVVSPTKTQRRFHWVFGPRYSVRGLVVAVTVLAVAFGIVTERARRQHDAVNRLRAMGVGIRYDYQLRPPVNGRQNPSSISRLLGMDMCHNVVSVIVHDSHDASTALPIVKRLPRLRTVEYCWNNDFDRTEKTFKRYTKELRGVEIQSIMAIVG